MSRPRLLRMRCGGGAGFTLLELLVVVGLIAILSGVVLAGLGGRSGTALEAGQAVIEQMTRAARERAVASARPTRILVHHDPTHADRFLRIIALQERVGEEWSTVATAGLPEDVRIVPHQTHAPTGLFPDESRWRRPDGARLHSSALFSAAVSTAIDTAAVEEWVPLQFAAHGTIATSGQIVVATVRFRGRGSGGEIGFEFVDPEQVRGVQLSIYGLALPIGRREAF